ncbi:hypothetical protein AVEN_146146-1 [Araneus ventricosus]|uniref:Uncharacterized protein n=1 Tax=Araneus ventricosus TaxID=182803 RepID=A0A4Y2EFL1_ARAVE|nr:hypothetical protein AVEN_146146-1 [Araneus ventricosus]
MILRDRACRKEKWELWFSISEFLAFEVRCSSFRELLWNASPPEELCLIPEEHPFHNESHSIPHPVLVPHDSPNRRLRMLDRSVQYCDFPASLLLRAVREVLRQSVPRPQSEPAAARMQLECGSRSGSCESKTALIAPLTLKKLVRSGSACTYKPNLAIMKWWEIIPPEQYAAVLEEFSKERPAEDESEASDLDGDVAEYIEHETDSEIDVEDKPVYEESSDSNSNTIVRIIHPFNL